MRGVLRRMVLIPALFLISYNHSNILRLDTNVES